MGTKNQLTKSMPNDFAVVETAFIFIMNELCKLLIFNKYSINFSHGILQVDSLERNFSISKHMMQEFNRWNYWTSLGNGREQRSFNFLIFAIFLKLEVNN